MEESQEMVMALEQVQSLPMTVSAPQYFPSVPMPTPESASHSLKAEKVHLSPDSMVSDFSENQERHPHPRKFLRKCPYILKTVLPRGSQWLWNKTLASSSDWCPFELVRKEAEVTRRR